MHRIRIRVSTAIIAINKLSEYYSKTDASVYNVALGKYQFNLIIFYKFLKFKLIFLIVLDPRLKLQYMKDQKWERKWVDNAKKKVLNINILYLYI